MPPFEFTVDITWRAAIILTLNSICWGVVVVIACGLLASAMEVKYKSKVAIEQSKIVVESRKKVNGSASNASKRPKSDEKIH